MKTILTLITLASTTLIQAHPGAPGHTHPENTGQNEWPFPDFSWSIIIVALALISFATYKKAKNQ